MTFTCDVAQQDNNIDEIDAFFNGGGMIDKKVQVTSPATQLKVLPLPTPKPQHFSGGVGQFQLTAQLISPQPRTNDIGTLRLTVTGTGNLKLIKAPDVAFPKDFDNYPAKVTDNVRITPEGVTGNMQFDYTFVPQNVGSYTIPSVQLVYFDPEKRSYVTAQTAPITLQIRKGEKTREETNAQLGLSYSDILGIVVESFRYIPILRRALGFTSELCDNIPMHPPIPFETIRHCGATLWQSCADGIQSTPKIGESRQRG